MYHHRRPLAAFIFHSLLCSSVIAGATLAHAQSQSKSQQDSERQWIAGDHHIHSRFSTGWDREQNPPAAILGGDAIYPTPMNALMARYYGLGWMVTTDHGGPNHSQVNLQQAYPELQQSRLVVPDVIQFYGMEFDTPGADHSSLIMPHTHDEADRLHSIESSFNKREPWPADPTWDTEPRMLEALRFMKEFPEKPVIIAHHPSRSAPAVRQYGLTTPHELRSWNDLAPGIAIGMEGAPGHQAAALHPGGTIDRNGARGGYGNHPTMGGFDQLTAIVGGFWDSMLSEGRNWWITANSDSHVHYSEGGSDFWPGEYSKTYVWAEKSHEDILDGIRGGRVFVTTGDLISELYVTAESAGEQAHIGGTLSVPAGQAVTITIRFLDPDSDNHHGDNPAVTRIDLIAGEMHGHVSDPATDTHEHTEVVARFTEADWTIAGDYREVSYHFDSLPADHYIRVRGTNTAQLEPELDPRGEDPWSDLWFYANPIRFHVED
ncbi:phosphoesterase [Pseudohongiella sp.]|uniref:Phosphoesterase n=1 Tax=marine sediment metagenome TaxID=412755 RepID=A0A0F9Y4K9_9ZZZZ|nr:phosphoesterase [Pseudohongiella sp.]HDZ09998.1 phosphoesterase [Pseudohongiella sp.]HEA63894.1 phosphoesterase [Pseudohongiella sp.]